MRRLSALFVVVCLSIPGASHAQQGTGVISGTIIGHETAQPLQYVTVTVDGTRHRARTGADGKFRIVAVDSGSHRLRAILLGYAPQVVEPVIVTADQTTTVDIRLQAVAAQLSEMVSVGYGTQARGAVTGAVATADPAKLVETPTPNISNALAGRVPGVFINNRRGEPGNDNADLYIRGKATLGNNSPLIVVDGVADRDDYSRLNPDDIESISVLKDASAAIYGARAANGVILITTKRGAVGKARISYRTSYGTQAPAALPKLLNAVQYATYINEVNASRGLAPQYTPDEIRKFADGSDPILYPNTDWLGAVLRPSAPQSEHQLQVSGGSEQVRYFMSGQYLSQDGILRNNSVAYQQYNLRTNGDISFTNLTVSLLVNGRIESRQGSSRATDTNIREAAVAYPTAPGIYPNGLLSTGIQNNNPIAFAGGLSGYNNQKDYALSSTLKFNLALPSIVDGLYVSGFGAFDFTNRNRKQFNDIWDQYTYNRTTGVFTNTRDVLGTISLTRDFTESASGTVNIGMGLNRDFGPHRIEAFVAHERFQNGYNEFNAYRRDFLTDKLQEIFAGGDNLKNNGGSAGRSARAHYFGRVNYNFRDRYLASFSLRRDGSYAFPQSRRWGTFPSLSAGWRISQEPFFHLSGVDDLKLRASWGRVGNDRINPYQFLTNFSFGGGYFLGIDPAKAPSLVPGVEPNPNITWEVADKTNVGFEAVLWKGLVSFDFNYFFDRRNNILVQPSGSVPQYTGLSLPQLNMGRVANRGIDGSIVHHRAIGGFQYDLSGNFTYARNRVDFVDEAPNTPAWQRREGYPIDSYLLYKSCGIYRTQAQIDATPHLPGTAPGDLCYADVNGDGKITADDRVRIHESATPTFQYGFGTGASYKRISVDLLWQGQAGATVLLTPQDLNNPATPPQWLFNDRWTPQTPNARYPRSFDRNNANLIRQSDFWLRNAKFLRLKSASVTYRFPVATAARFNLSDMRVYVQGFNLLTLSGIPNYDAEISTTTTYYYPQMRIVRGGFSVGL
ncbi:MAG: TonB-dependent receptor [Gemmatimonadaceae bacterium]